MICAVSSSSITTLMLNQQMNSSVNAFKFVLSHHFIEHINVKFQNDPARLDLFKQWLAYRANFENRVRYIGEDEVLEYFNIQGEDDIYASCAYFAGHFIFDELTHQSQTYVDYGIDVSSIINYKNFLGRGDNPIFEKTLTDGGNESPNALCKYFKNESNVTFIDNYINKKSIDFIKHVIMGLRNGAHVTIVTKKASFNKAKSFVCNDIAAVRSDLNIYFYYLDEDKEFHDRHILIGNRIYIRSTSGLDAFSYNGLWNNREGTFSVYDVHESTTVKNFNARDISGSLIAMKIKRVDV
ncbi:MIT C-terminal domain-containing protein [Aeromonas caviae]|uniref:MIT C-terminal domain-containing protein n=2 Tax=Aeromonas caviae TaxID=648 RepID=UPI00107258CD|nr:MIT C-terminal domain-containing protein [Aeromonas caviae]WGY74282.1 hypothetical protein MLL77_13595 [Aeromonas caviae]